MFSLVEVFVVEHELVLAFVFEFELPAAVLLEEEEGLAGHLKLSLIKLISLV